MSKDLLSNDYWMGFALSEAKKSLEKNEVPVGAVIVLNDEIIGKGHNMTISTNDPSSHAEIEAIRHASKTIGNYRLNNTNLYVTLEPCCMCYGAIVHARISRIVFGAYDPKTGVCGSSIKLHGKEFFNHTPDVKGGILEEDCSLILKNFFKEKRN